jgi:hypothetical protein
MFDLLETFFENHIAALSLAQKKELLPLLNNTDKWQEFIGKVISRTEEKIFIDEFSKDVATIDSEELIKLDTHSSVVKEELQKREHRSQVRNAFEKWAKNGVNPPSDIMDDKMFVAYRKHAEICFVENYFRHKDGDWDVNALMFVTLQFCKSPGERQKDVSMWIRVILSKIDSYIKWLKDALKSAWLNELIEIVIDAQQMLGYLSEKNKGDKIKKIINILQEGYINSADHYPYILIDLWIELTSNILEITKDSVIYGAFASGVACAYGSISRKVVENLDDARMRQILSSYRHLR